MTQDDVIKDEEIAAQAAAWGVFYNQGEVCTAASRLLVETSIKDDFIYRHQWRKGDMLIWDNRSLQHFAVADYGSQPRTMHRVTVLGDRPY